MLKVSLDVLCWITPFAFCDYKQMIWPLLAADEGLTLSSVAELIKKLDSHEEQLGKMV